MNVKSHKYITVLLLLLCINYSPLIHTHISNASSNLTYQTTLNQQQDDWIFLQEINNVPQSAYLKRNATYYMPVTSEEVNSTASIYVKLNNWYLANSNPVKLIYQVLDPENSVAINGTAAQSSTNIRLNINTYMSGIWKLILFLDYAKLNPLNSGSQAEANVDIQVSINNLQASVSFESNEYESWDNNQVKDLLLRTIDSTFKGYFLVGNITSYSISVHFFNDQNKPSITTIDFAKNASYTTNVSYDKVTSITNPNVYPVYFDRGTEGLWSMKINFDTSIQGSVQVIKFTDVYGNPVKMYMRPTNGEPFIDNNFDGISDLASASVSNSTNLTRSNLTQITLSSVPLPIEPVILAFVVLGIVALRKKSKIT